MLNTKYKGTQLENHCPNLKNHDIEENSTEKFETKIGYYGALFNNEFQYFEFNEKEHHEQKFPKDINKIKYLPLYKVERETIDNKWFYKIPVLINNYYHALFVLSDLEDKSKQYDNSCIIDKREKRENLVNYLKDNFQIEYNNRIQIDLSDLDFGEDKLDVYLTGMNCNGNIHVSCFKNTGNVFSNSHNNHGDVYQTDHINQGKVYNNEHIESEEKCNQI